MVWLPAEDRAALGVLRAELGWLGALTLAARLRSPFAADPFAELPPAADSRERASRAQAGGAVRLYRVLRRRRDADAALDLTARVVHAAALAFLERTLGSVGPTDLAGLAPDARRAWVRERLDRFPNVEASVVRAEPEAVVFTVHRCRLVELVRHAGHPELASLFCAADAVFFGDTRPGLRLERPTTLAAGGPACAFHIHRTESR